MVGCSSRNTSADLVLVGTTIYTQNPSQAEAQALAIHAGKIVFVGSDEEAKDYIGDST